MVKLRLENKEWIEVEKDDDNINNMTLDGNLRAVLDIGKKRLGKDFDFAIVIGGDVGSGKSNAGRIIARYISNENFHPKTHIIQDVNDIEKILSKAKKGEAVLFDEASGIFSATDTLTKKTKYANQVLDVCRQANLCLIIIAPGFHRLSTAVAIDRTDCFIRTYTVKGSQGRGPFAFYGKKGKEKLYLSAKKNFGSHKMVRPKFRGWIGEDKTFSPEYRKVKDQTFKKVLSSFNDEKIKPLNPKDIEREYRLNIVMNNKDVGPTKLAKILRCDRSTIYQIKADIKERLDKELLLRDHLKVKIQQNQEV